MLPNSANWPKVQSQKTNSNLDLDRIERKRDFITINVHPFLIFYPHVLSHRG
jgi:hypothetical protein